ncbi:MAG TPA: hypothetical protein VIL69_18820 [Roseomonas sp.]|jgi:hypothetical protein
MKPLPLALLPALLLGACTVPPAAGPRAGGPVAGPAGVQATRSAANVACRAEAERIVRYRDRGQVMRQDDYNARVGTTSHLGPQVMMDQMAQIHDRDRIAAECVRGATGNESPRAAPGPAPGGAPAGR